MSDSKLDLILAQLEEIKHAINSKPQKVRPKTAKLDLLPPNFTERIDQHLKEKPMLDYSGRTTLEVLQGIGCKDTGHRARIAVGNHLKSLGFYQSQFFRHTVRGWYWKRNAAIESKIRQETTSPKAIAAVKKEHKRSLYARKQDLILLFMDWVTSTPAAASYGISEAEMVEFIARAGISRRDMVEALQGTGVKRVFNTGTPDRKPGYYYAYKPDDEYEFLTHSGKKSLPRKEFIKMLELEKLEELC